MPASTARTSPSITSTRMSLLPGGKQDAASSASASASASAPLRLKSSSNSSTGSGTSTSTSQQAAAAAAPAARAVQRQSSSSSHQEVLLDWAKQVTASYAGVKVTNLTTSFRNGLAFCAIIHHYRPHLMYSISLSSSTVHESFTYDSLYYYLHAILYCKNAYSKQEQLYSYSLL